MGGSKLRASSGRARRGDPCAAGWRGAARGVGERVAGLAAGEFCVWCVLVRVAALIVGR